MYKMNKWLRLCDEVSVVSLLQNTFIVCRRARGTDTGRCSEGFRGLIPLAAQ